MARRYIHACAAILVLSMLGVERCRAGVVIFASDLSWRASAMNADESVGVPLGHAECYPIPVPFDPAQIFGGACVVWLPGMTPQSPADDQGAFFTKTIMVSGAPVAGILWVAADDWVQVTVNGIVVCTRGSITDYGQAAAAQNPPLAYDITQTLTTGANTVQVWARNGPNFFAGGCTPCPWSVNNSWVYFGGSIAYDSPVATARRTWGSLKSIYR